MSAMSSTPPCQTISPRSRVNQSASFAGHLKTLKRAIPLRGRYENFIGGQWVAPTKGAYSTIFPPPPARSS